MAKRLRIDGLLEHSTEVRGLDFAITESVVSAHRGVTTIAQVFVGGEFVGGCTDLLEGWRNGRVPRLLGAAGVDYDRAASVEPRAFLPTWLH